MKRLICWFKGHDWLWIVGACRRCGKLLEDDLEWSRPPDVMMKPGDVLLIPRFDSAGRPWEAPPEVREPQSVEEPHG